MTVLYLSEQRERRGLSPTIEREPVPFDERQMARLQVRRRLLDLCNETAVTLAELYAVRLIDSGKLIHDAVKAAVEHALRRQRPRNDPEPPRAA
jgi:hypothetical protein